MRRKSGSNPRVSANISIYVEGNLMHGAWAESDRAAPQQQALFEFHLAALLCRAGAAEKPHI